MVGQIIGNFRLVSLLGRGGMGEVYLAEHVGIQTKVAVKLLMRDVSAQQDQVQRFFNEARIVSKIKHAGIVKIFDVGHHEGQAYLIMELLEGESLARRIERCGRMSGPQLADITRQIASVLAATHAAGVTHRDLKPDNIFLVPDAELATHERIKILDFGIAKLSGGTMAAGAAKTVGTMGTPAYMAPEQWADSGSVDWRVDAYALGCVAFEMATGRVPFVANTIAEAYVKHAQVAPPAPRTLVPDLPLALDAAIVQLLAKDARQRGASMQDIARTFASLGGDGASFALDVTLGADAILPLPAVTIAPSSVGALIAAPRSNTTLGASVGQQLAPAATKRNKLAWPAAAVMIAIVVVAGVAFTMRGSGDAVAIEPARPAAAPVVAPVAPPTPAPSPGPEPVKAPTLEAAHEAPVETPPPAAVHAQPAAVRSSTPHPAVRRPATPAPTPTAAPAAAPVSTPAATPAPSAPENPLDGRT